MRRNDNSKSKDPEKRKNKDHRLTPVTCSYKTRLRLLEKYTLLKPANPEVGNWRNNGPEMLDGPK
jgi:hypothetical protein